jgi:hypothetical protein
MEYIEKGYTGRNSYILSDSQAAIKDLDSFQINSKLVWDCHQHPAFCTATVLTDWTPTILVVLDGVTIQWVRQETLSGAILQRKKIGGITSVPTIVSQFKFSMAVFKHPPRPTSHFSRLT